MSKIIGIKPDAETQKLIGKFEDEVLIRHNNQPLVGTVYVDMQEDRWSVAFAYNYNRSPGIQGHENPLEVRYLVKPKSEGGVHIFRSDEDEERVLGSGEQFGNVDSFIRFVLTEERRIACGAV
jgi:hypothetical protein